MNSCSILFLLIDYGKVLGSSANELQQNSDASCKEEYIPLILTVLQKFIAFSFDLRGPLSLSVIRKQQLKQCNYSVGQSELLTSFRTEFSVIGMEFQSLQTSLLAKRLPNGEQRGETAKIPQRLLLAAQKCKVSKGEQISNIQLPSLPLNEHSIVFFVLSTKSIFHILRRASSVVRVNTFVFRSVLFWAFALFCYTKKGLES